MTDKPAAPAAAPKTNVKICGHVSERIWKDVVPVKVDETGTVAVRSIADFFVDFVGTNNLLVLAGSGTSVGDRVGGPSMTTLWNDVSKVPNFAVVAKAVGHPEKVLNVEELLSRCMAAHPYIEPELGKQVQAFIADAQKVILSNCTSFLAKADLNTHREFLRRLTHRTSGKPRFRLFTTNYDRCFEEAASSLGFVAVDGFSYSLPRRYSPNLFNLDFVRRDSRQREAPDYAENIFHLIKIHGSVDWDRMENGDIVQTATPKNACLVYPARNKYELSFTQPHLEMLGQFLLALREPNTALITVGFGFNDDHLTQPIRAAIENNSGLRVAVVDRSCEAKSASAGTFHEMLRKRAEHMDDRITLVNASFDEFVPLIPNLARQTQEERLETITRLLVKKT